MSPFSGKPDWFPHYPIAADAIPNLGDNQQIVLVDWPGRSPRDVENQITYPLSNALLGVAGVKSVRSSSMFGLSMVYVIFNDDVDYYWSRSRLLEKLNALPQNLLPQDVVPKLGPDATGLGQVFWYTVEPSPTLIPPALEQLRSIQDAIIKPALSGVQGVAEVGSIGGYVKEYQVELDPIAMKNAGVSALDVESAIRASNRDVGAGTLELNRVEYVIRGLGYIESLQDLQKTVVSFQDGLPIELGAIAHIQFGPAERRGGIDRNGTEAVGGVVVIRYGANPLEVLGRVKAKIETLNSSLPKIRSENGQALDVSILPFYDRSNLIRETIGTLQQALFLQVAVTILVVLVLIRNIRSAFIISSILPLGILLTFLAMKFWGLDANIVALSGIAIAIGVMVDIGIVLVERIGQDLEDNPTSTYVEMGRSVLNSAESVYKPILTAVATTILSFLPIFFLQGEEGRLFIPLALTKTFALFFAVLLGLSIIPLLSHLAFGLNFLSYRTYIRPTALLLLAGISWLFFPLWISILLLIFSFVLVWIRFKDLSKNLASKLEIGMAILFATLSLSTLWLPLSPEFSLLSNTLFIIFLLIFILGGFMGFAHFYEHILMFCLHKRPFVLGLCTVIVLMSLLSWFGWKGLTGYSDENGSIHTALNQAFPGLGKEFMPPLDEGSFLFMPTTMAHAGVEQVVAFNQELDQQIYGIPEIDMVLGKWGRVESALDPAPISMYETTVLYKNEYKVDDTGKRIRFKVDDEGTFIYDEKGQLIPDHNGRYFRQWRDHIKSKNDIWDHITQVTQLTGITSSPQLQPIETRLMMLSTGMRAKLGVKIFGSTLADLANAGEKLEPLVKGVEGIVPATVFVERVIGKPYIHLEYDRQKLARYGILIDDAQRQLERALGGFPLTFALENEGRERYPVRLRLAREWRDAPEDILRLPIESKLGLIELGQVANIVFERGPQSIKSENTFLVNYLTFGQEKGLSEVDAVERIQKAIDEAKKEGRLTLPDGVHLEFAGQYQNQLRATQRLQIIIPIVLVLIFSLIYFQFKSAIQTLFIFSGILISLSGGFILLGLFNSDWFLNVNMFGIDFRSLFNVKTINLSVAVWVGFLALFGIATDDGVLMSDRILNRMQEFGNGVSINDLRQEITSAAKQRVNAAVITSVTTIIALLPILTSGGKGAGIMIPMAIPMLGGMMISVVNMLLVPMLTAWWIERQQSKQKEVQA